MSTPEVQAQMAELLDLLKQMRDDTDDTWRKVWELAADISRGMIYNEKHNEQVLAELNRLTTLHAEREALVAEVLEARKNALEARASALEALAAMLQDPKKLTILAVTTVILVGMVGGMLKFAPIVLPSLFGL